MKNGMLQPQLASDPIVYAPWSVNVGTVKRYDQQTGHPALLAFAASGLVRYCALLLRFEGTR